MPISERGNWVIPHDKTGSNWKSERAGKDTDALSSSLHIQRAGALILAARAERNVRYQIKTSVRMQTQTE